MDAGSAPLTAIGFVLPVVGGIGVKAPAASILNAVTVSLPLFATYRCFVSEEIASAPGAASTAAGLGLAGVGGTNKSAPSVETLNAVTLFVLLFATYAKNPFDDTAMAEGAETFENGEPGIAARVPLVALMLYPDTLSEPLFVT